MIRGLDDVLRNLDKSDGLLNRAASNAAETIAQDVRTNAVRSIQSLSSGRDVMRYTAAGNGYIHIASADGDAPNTDMGNLVNDTGVSPKGIGFEVISGAAYSAALEFGTIRMSARPYMIPASEKSRRKVPKVLQSAVNRELAKL